MRQSAQQTLLCNPTLTRTWRTTAYQIDVGSETEPGAADREIKIYVRFSLVARPAILVRDDRIRAMP